MNEQEAVRSEQVENSQQADTIEQAVEGEGRPAPQSSNDRELGNGGTLEPTRKAEAHTEPVVLPFESFLEDGSLPARPLSFIESTYEMRYIADYPSSGDDMWVRCSASSGTVHACDLCSVHLAFACCLAVDSSSSHVELPTNEWQDLQFFFWCDFLMPWVPDSQGECYHQAVAYCRRTFTPTM